VLDEHGRLNHSPAPGILFGRGLRLLTGSRAQSGAIFLSSVVLFEWAADDRATRRLVAAQLVNAKLATRVEVSPRFWTARQHRQSYRPAGGG
jgi:hypothetical protein